MSTKRTIKEKKIIKEKELYKIKPLFESTRVLSHKIKGNNIHMTILGFPNYKRVLHP